MFAVGRGFPLVKVKHPGAFQSPWLSLNRIYYRNSTAGLPKFRTRDLSRGHFVLEPSQDKSRAPPGSWQIHKDKAKKAPEAHTVNEVPHMDELPQSSWNVQGKDILSAHVGFRRGKYLRDHLFRFARNRSIGIGELYMI